MRVSLVVTTYNRPEALALSLKSIAAQSRLPDEVIIGDDGSADATRCLIEDIAKTFPVPLQHVWQPDDGFRLARIRNKAISAATGDYIIQIDGDIVLHHRFVADHMSVARKGRYVKGSRVRLSPDFTAAMCASGEVTLPGIWGIGILKDREKALRLPGIGALVSRFYKRNSVSGIGCNMAFMRNDAIAVNGYDEEFVGWGAEDNDFCRRMLAAGCEGIKLFRMGICYHLWHKELPPSAANFALADTARDVRCLKGIDQYLKD